MSVHFSSKKDGWETPQKLFDQYDNKYHFDVDVCANAGNAKCARYFDIELNGLSQEWRGMVWMNPPYGRDIAKWMKKAYESSQAGATVVCLVPARTDTAWWHDYAMRGEVELLRGRLKFGGHENYAPFPSAVVVFKPSPDAGKSERCRSCDDTGDITTIIGEWHGYCNCAAGKSSKAEFSHGE